MKKLSTKGAEFIGGFEGFREECYDDATGNCTIGYGHLIHYGKTTDADKKTWGKITKSRGSAILISDAGQFAAAVNRYVTIPLTQAQFDALVSLGFNCGTGAIKDVAAVVNAKPKRWNAWKLPIWRHRVKLAFSKWCHGNGGVVLQGLLRRRFAEATLFTTGKYTATQGNKFV